MRHIATFQILMVPTVPERPEMASLRGRFGSGFGSRRARREAPGGVNWPPNVRFIVLRQHFIMFGFAFNLYGSSEFHQNRLQNPSELAGRISTPLRQTVRQPDEVGCFPQKLREFPVQIACAAVGSLRREMWNVGKPHVNRS